MTDTFEDFRAGNQPLLGAKSSPLVPVEWRATAAGCDEMAITQRLILARSSGIASSGSRARSRAGRIDPREGLRSGA